MIDSFLFNLYRGLGYLLTPFFLFHSNRPDRRGHLPEAEIWIHASSVGEAGVAAAIIKSLRHFRPCSHILLTLQTTDGQRQAQKLLQETTLTSLAPYDLMPWARRALRSVCPRILVLVETELWPNLIEEAKRQKVPVVLVNGRLSARSLSRYRLVKPLMAKLLDGFYALGVIGPLEKERFLSLGAEEEKIFVYGNAKYDLLWERAQQLIDKRPQTLPQGLKWVVLGSIRSGEEEFLLDVITHFRRSHPELGFVLAPRHLKLVPSLEKRLKARGLSWARWSSKIRKTPLLLLDKIGPLLEVYAQAHLAFVGGSLVPKGGQNPLEPAAFKIPVFFGPYMDNFLYEAQELLNNKGGIQIKNKEDLIKGITEFILKDTDRIQYGKRAFKSLEKFLGASERYAELIIRALNHLPLG